VTTSFARWRLAATVSALAALGIAALAAVGGPAAPARAGSVPHRQQPFLSGAGAPVTNTVTNTPDGIATSNPGFNGGFAGVSALDSFSVTGFDVEPPDQGLCVGGGHVLDTVNVAQSVYSTSGTLESGPTYLNTFFNEDPAVFQSDPRCYYDPATQRWFVEVLMSDLSSFSRIDLAVSKTSDPNGGYYQYRIDNTNAGQGGCPCFGDQPLMAVDGNGVYFNTNMYDMNSLKTYKGAFLFALDKAALEAGTLPRVVQVAVPNTTPAGARPGSLQPAQSPTGAAVTAANGTEYFLSGNSFNGGTQHSITAWALSGTATLASAHPSLTLGAVSLNSETYSVADKLAQPNGPIPLGSSLFGATTVGPLNAGDDRMQGVVYQAGRLWGALNTDVNGVPGLAWFVVNASGGGPSFAASMLNQGFLTGAGQLGLAYPSFGVTSSGTAVMTFDAMGPNNFPSVGYVTLTATGRPSLIHLAYASTVPYDGYTCYIRKHLGGPCRMGDYTASVVAADGSVWFAGETALEHSATPQNDNWGTFIGNVTP
jgi:hypothetical protein